MALFEMWCSTCNELHDSANMNNATTKRNIKPGQKVWVRLQDSPPPQAKIRKNMSKKPMLLKKVMGGKRINKSLSFDNSKNDSVTETSKWKLVPVLSRCGNHITVQMQTGFKVIDLDKDKLCLPGNEFPVDDMTELHYVHEPAILHNLKTRALKKKPYTFIGNVLVSINPLQDVDKHLLFDDGTMPPHPRTVAERAYEKMLFAASQRRRLQEMDIVQERETGNKLAPRDVSLQDKNSKFARQFGLVNQCILLSGESGSGKTEASKRVLQQLVEREGYGFEFSDDDDPGVFDFQDNLMGTDPILESFGNAKTKRNPNSSRFGKFMQLMYQPALDDEDYEEQYFLYSAKITTYLLERSRVTYQEPGESNYRIFYQLLTSPNDKIHSHLGFTHAGLKFRYLNNTFTRADHDRIGYQNLRIALRMAKLGVRTLELFQVVAAVLHLGNIKFEEENTSEGGVAKVKEYHQEEKKPSQPESPHRRKRHGGSFLSVTSVRDRLLSNQGKGSRLSRRPRKSSAGTFFTVGSGTSGAQTQPTLIRTPNPSDRRRYRYSPLQFTAKLLGIKKSRLSKMLTETLVTIGGGESILKRVDVAVAEQRRDALAKHIYGLLFEWLVSSMNAGLHTDPDEENLDDIAYIGILDVFGFEKFQKNSFEQLLINYTNEVLLSLFATEILIGESEIYRQEELVLQHGELPETAKVTAAYESCLQLFEGHSVNKKFTPGLFTIINAQGKVPQPSDKKLLQSMQKSLSKHEKFVQPHPSVKDKCFIIKHYASEVRYEIENFLQKNDQSIPNDVEQVFKSSKHRIVRAFPFILMSQDQKREEEQRRQRGSSAAKKKPIRKKNKLKKGKNGETVVGTFSRQMQALQRVLNKTACSYIRCVKPNPSLVPPNQTVRMRVPGLGGDIRAEAMLKTTKSAFVAATKMKERKLSFAVSKKKVLSKKYFEDDYVSQQLKNLGVYECVNVLKAGLPTRIPYKTFMMTFASAVSLEDLDFYKNRPMDYQRRTYVAALMKMNCIESTAYKLGKSRIFFRSGQLDHIKGILEKGLLSVSAKKSSKQRNKLVRKFKKYYTRKLWRVAFAKTKVMKYFLDDLQTVRAARIIQRAARRFLFTKKFSQKVRDRWAATFIQKIFRGYKARVKTEHLRAELMRNDISGMIDGMSIVTGTVGATRDTQLPGDATNWESVSDGEVEVEEGPEEDSIDFMSAFSSVGENNAMRGTLMSYFNRRTTYNRKTKMLPSADDVRKWSEKTGLKGKNKSSLFTRHQSDAEWKETEVALWEFDGFDAEDDINPLTPNDDLMNIFEDNQDLEEFESQEEGEEVGEDNDTDLDMGATANSSRTGAGTREASRILNGGSLFGDDLDLISKELRASGIRASKNSRNLRRTRATRITTRGTRKPVTRGTRRKPSQTQKRASSRLSSDSFENINAADDLLNKSSNSLSVANQFLKGDGGVKKATKPKQQQKLKPKGYVPYSDSNNKKLVNKLNPSKGNYHQKRDPEKPVPLWQKIKLKKVVVRKKSLESTESTASKEEVNYGEGNFTLRIAEKFGGSMRRIKKKL